MHVNEDKTGLYGLMAEFDQAQPLVDAAIAVMSHGYSKVEGYSPFPIEELNDIIHRKRTVLPKLVLGAGLSGMAAGFGLQYWSSVIEYPLNVGGRPLATWTAWVVPSYELTILFAAITAAAGMIALCGLPQPYHPVFNVERFAMASSDKFFLVVEAADPRFHRDETARLLESLGAKGVYDVAE